MKTSILFLLLSGCGIHFTVVEGTMGTTGFAEEVNRGRRAYNSGVSDNISSDYENPLEKKTTYRQIPKPTPELPAMKE